MGKKALATDRILLPVRIKKSDGESVKTKEHLSTGGITHRKKKSIGQIGTNFERSGRGLNPQVSVRRTAAYKAAGLNQCPTAPIETQKATPNGGNRTRDLLSVGARLAPLEEYTAKRPTSYSGALSAELRQSRSAPILVRFLQPPQDKFAIYFRANREQNAKSVEKVS